MYVKNFLGLSPLVLAVYISEYIPALALGLFGEPEKRQFFITTTKCLIAISARLFDKDVWGFSRQVLSFFLWFRS